MDITELIIEKLNHRLSDEKETKLNQWLKESYMHETMMLRLQKMKEEGHDFAEVRELNPSEAWKKIENKEN